MLTLLEFALQNLLFIGLHLDSRSSFPKQLSPKEEEECIALIAQGDMDARGKLIEHNLRLVAYIVNKNYPEAVRGCQQDADDLISIGTIGLIRAAETFDYTKGRRFSTYASRCIDNAITHQRKHIREFQERHISVVATPWQAQSLAMEPLPRICTFLEIPERFIFAPQSSCCGVFSFP